MNAFTKILGGAALVASMAVAANANASGLNYISSWNASNSAPLQDGGVDLLVATSLNTNAGNFTVNFGSGPGSAINTAISISPLNLTLPAPYSAGSVVPISGYSITFSTDGNGSGTGAGGSPVGDIFTFTESYANLTRNGVTGQSGLFIQVNGTVSDASGYFATQNALLTETVNETGGQIGGSISFTTPVPEPISMGLLAMGLVGLAAVRRRA